MPDDPPASVEDAVAGIAAAESDDEILKLEAVLLERTDNDLRPGDPPDQPPAGDAE